MLPMHVGSPGQTALLHALLAAAPPAWPGHCCVNTLPDIGFSICHAAQQQLQVAHCLLLLQQGRGCLRLAWCVSAALAAAAAAGRLLEHVRSVPLCCQPERRRALPIGHSYDPRDAQGSPAMGLPLSFTRLLLMGRRAASRGMTADYSAGQEASSGRHLPKIQQQGSNP